MDLRPAGIAVSLFVQEAVEEKNLLMLFAGRCHYARNKTRFTSDATPNLLKFKMNAK